MSVSVNQSKWNRPLSVTIPWSKESIKLSFCLRDFNRVAGGIAGLHKTTSHYGVSTYSQIDPLLESFDLAKIRKIIEEMSGQFSNIDRLTKMISVQNKKNSQVQTITILSSSVLFGASFTYLLKKHAGALFYAIFTVAILGIYKAFTSATQKIERRKIELLQKKATAEMSLLKRYNEVVTFYTDNSGKFPQLIKAFYNLSCDQDINSYQKQMIQDTFSYLAYFFEVCIDQIREKAVPSKIRKQILQQYQDCKHEEILKKFPKLSLLKQGASHVT